MGSKIATLLIPVPVSGYAPEPLPFTAHPTACLQFCNDIFQSPNCIQLLFAPKISTLTSVCKERRILERLIDTLLV